MAFLKDHADSATLRINRKDAANRAVEDELIVIVAQLNHAIALAIASIAGAQLAPTGIKQALQFAFQGLRAARSGVHRRQHLDFARILNSETANQAVVHELLDGREDILRGVAFEEEKVAFGIVV